MIKIQVKNEKIRLRSQLLAQRERFDPAEKAEIESKIFGYLRQLATYRYSDTVLLYSPIKGELDVNKVARAALSDGKRIAYPVTDPSSRTMRFYYVNSTDELSTGTYGIPEPPAGSELFVENVSVHTMCIVPALAFDYEGYRLGYGKGFYDRFLATFSGVKVGLIPAQFLFVRLPRGRYDVAVDVIITEDGVLAVGKGKN